MREPTAEALKDAEKLDVLMLAMDRVIVIGARGEMEIVRRGAGGTTSRRLKGSVWTAEDMARYVTMSVKERRVFRELKMRFRAESEWMRR